MHIWNIHTIFLYQYHLFKINIYFYDDFNSMFYVFQYSGHRSLYECYLCDIKMRATNWGLCSTLNMKSTQANNEILNANESHSTFLI
jgi:hypothetical protein